MRSGSVCRPNPISLSRRATSEVPSTRAYILDDLDGDKKPEPGEPLRKNSGRAQVYDFVRKPAEPLVGGFSRGQFQIVPLNRTKKSRRGLCWADLNGDSLPDLAGGRAGQRTDQPLFLSNDRTAPLATPLVFPTFTGSHGYCQVADWDADGTPEIFLLSEDERQIGSHAFRPRAGESLSPPFCLEDTESRL